MLIIWQDVTCERQTLKPSFLGALGHTSENWDKHEGELRHASIALFTIPMSGEIISTMILKYLSAKEIPMR